MMLTECVKTDIEPDLEDYRHKPKEWAINGIMPGPLMDLLAP